MSEDELNAIEARSAVAIPVAGGDYADWSWAGRAYADRNALVAEVRRLRDLLERATRPIECRKCGIQLGAVYSCARCDE